MTPHNCLAKSGVTETRAHEGVIYRRRCCKVCGAHVVTMETAPDGLRMPYRPSRTPARAMRSAQIVADTTELSRAWR